MNAGPDYPFGATGYDPETGRYSWDKDPTREIEPPVKPETLRWLNDEEIIDMARDL